jgi:hypothetical protein
VDAARDRGIASRKPMLPLSAVVLRSVAPAIALIARCASASRLALQGLKVLDEVYLLCRIADRDVHHERVGNCLCAVGDPLAQIILGPNQARFLERVGIGETREGSRRSTYYAVEAGAEEEGLAFLQRVANSAMIVEGFLSSSLLGSKVVKSETRSVLCKPSRCGRNDADRRQKEHPKKSHHYTSSRKSVECYR